MFIKSFFFRVKSLNFNNIYSYKVFVADTSIIKLSVQINNLQQQNHNFVANSKIFVSNNSQHILSTLQLNNRLINTKININLSNKDLNLDINQLKNHKFIQQINTNQQLPTKTPDLSRVIIHSEIDQKKINQQDFYKNISNNVLYIQKVIKSLTNINPAFLIQKQLIIFDQYLKLLQKKRKALDLNIIQNMIDQKDFFTFLFEKCYKLDHIYLRGYSKMDGKYFEQQNFEKNIINFKQLFGVLNMNYFKGTIILKCDQNYIENNVRIIQKILHQSIYTEKDENNIHDDWTVL